MQQGATMLMASIDIHPIHLQIQNIGSNVAVRDRFECFGVDVFALKFGDCVQQPIFDFFHGCFAGLWWREKELCHIRR